MSQRPKIKKSVSGPGRTLTNWLHLYIALIRLFFEKVNDFLLNCVQNQNTNITIIIIIIFFIY